MATTNGSDVEARTVYAKPFQLSTNEESIRQLFSLYGRVRKVKLRKDEASNVFRGSVYVEFDSEAAAQKAVDNPPLQIGSSSQRLHVMLKSEYNRKKRAASDKHADVSHALKRPRDSHTATPSEAAPHASSGPGSAAYWQHLCEDNEKRIRELEQHLKQEKDSNAAMLNKLMQAQHAMEEALARESGANRKLLTKEAEMGSLKGEAASVRKEMSSKLDVLHVQYKARIHDLEIQIQQLKDQITQLRHEGRQAKSTTPPPSGLLDDL